MYADTVPYHQGYHIEETLSKVSQQLEEEAKTLAEIRTAIERCEKQSSVISPKVLNLPTKVGKVLE